MPDVEIGALLRPSYADSVWLVLDIQCADAGGLDTVLIYKSDVHRAEPHTLVHIRTRIEYGYVAMCTSTGVGDTQ